MSLVHGRDVTIAIALHGPSIPCSELTLHWVVPIVTDPGHCGPQVLVLVEWVNVFWNVVGEVHPPDDEVVGEALASALIRIRCEGSGEELL